jgi:hypothetical protein
MYAGRSYRVPLGRFYGTRCAKLNDSTGRAAGPVTTVRRGGDLRALALFFFICISTVLAVGPSDPFWTLWLYNGTWQVTRKDQPPQTLVNRCSSFGKFFACEQSVNGASVALLIFVPGSQPGHFFTQSVKSDGRAGGRGELQIEHNTWTYLSNWNEGGKTTFYRTTNVYEGRNRIHFEQAESSDNKTWVVKSSGDEVHPGGRR